MTTLMTHRRALAALLAVAVIIAAAVWRWLGTAPEAVLLLDEAPASWIVPDSPMFLGVHRYGRTAVFRAGFTLDAPARGGTAEVAVMKTADLRVDGRPLARIVDPERWRETRTITLPDLKTGTHELQVMVQAPLGPPGLMFTAPGWGLASGPHWETNMDSRTWRPAAEAGRRRVPALALRFPDAAEAMRRSLPFFAAFFILVFLAIRTAERRGPRSRLRALTPERLRWALLAAWAVLALNNIWRIPSHVGFDAAPHADYIRYIVENGRVPLASDGWQMFQAPLYYLLSAPFYAFLSGVLGQVPAEKALRLLPLLCGAAQVELCFRAVRRAFPERPDLQMAGTALGGLLPAALYQSQALGNEPLCSALSALAVVMAWGLAEAPVHRVKTGRVLALGAALGLAVLAKVTAVLLVPVVAVFLLWAWTGEDDPDRAEAGLGLVLRHLFLMFAAAALVSGWYFGRNLLSLGSLYVGGWDPARGIVWWQDPGFRTLGDMLSFGSALTAPVYAAAAGFWDALYSTFWCDGLLSGVIGYEARPPWNYSLMISGAWLALLPTAVMAWGAACAVSGTLRSGRRFVLFGVAAGSVYLAAMLAMFITVPIYSSAKAGYAAGLAPCFAVLGAAGLERLGRGRLRAAILSGWAVWAAAAYGAYFVLS